MYGRQRGATSEGGGHQEDKQSTKRGRGGDGKRRVLCDFESRSTELDVAKRWRGEPGARARTEHAGTAWTRLHTVHGGTARSTHVVLDSSRPPSDYYSYAASGRELRAHCPGMASARIAAPARLCTPVYYTHTHTYIHALSRALSAHENDYAPELSPQVLLLDVVRVFHFSPLPRLPAHL